MQVWTVAAVKGYGGASARYVTQKCLMGEGSECQSSAVPWHFSEVLRAGKERNSTGGAREAAVRHPRASSKDTPVC